MATILHEGVEYDVTDAWHAAYTEPYPELAQLSRSSLDHARWNILNLSNERPLTSAEEARLAAITHHYNVRNALHVLGCPDHTQFGFDGVDQLHGNRATLPCGCELNVVFDHHHAMAIAAAQDVVGRGKARDQRAYAHHAKLAGWKGEDHVEVSQREVTLHAHTAHRLCEDHEHLALPHAELHERIHADNRAASVAEA